MWKNKATIARFTEKRKTKVCEKFVCVVCSRKAPVIESAPRKLYNVLHLQPISKSFLRKEKTRWNCPSHSNDLRNSKLTNRLQFNSKINH